MTNIKDYREKEQKMYIIANILVLILLSSLNDTFNHQIQWFDMLVKLVNTSLLSSTIYIFAFLADSLFGSEIKMRLLYLGGHLPGETIFSTLKNKNKDLRFSTEHLLEKYKEIYNGMPTDNKKKYLYENNHWYRIYNCYRDIPMIIVSNRDYLLCRDLYVSTIIIFICYVISCNILPIFYWNVESVFYLLFMLLITNISAHVKGKRFVMNVLAYDLHTVNNQ